MSEVHRQQCLSQGQSSTCYNRLQVRRVTKRVNAATLRESNRCECIGRNAMPCLAQDEEGFSAADTERRQKQKVVDPVLAALCLSLSLTCNRLSFHSIQQGKRVASTEGASIWIFIIPQGRIFPLLLFYCTLSDIVNYTKPFVILLVVKIHKKITNKFAGK